MKTRQLIVCILFLGCLWIQLPLLFGGTAADPQTADDQYQIEVRRARALLNARQYNDAIRAFMQANKIRNNRSDECYWGIAQAYFELGAYEIAVENCDQAMKYTTDDYSRAQGHNLKGMALAEWANDRPELLSDAAREFQAGIALNSKPPVPLLHFNLGKVLLTEGEESSGVEELKTYLQMDPNGGSADQAERLMQNRPVSRQPQVVSRAPTFTAPTIEGDRLSMNDLKGKVVLLDFWATWCGPCRASLPDLKRLYQRYQNESRFVLVSVNTDHDTGKWRNFVREEGMDWTQVHDDGDHMGRQFNVRSIPTYIIISPDGILLHRFAGWGPGRGASIEAEINRALSASSRGQ